MRHIEPIKVRIAIMTQEERDIIANFIARVGGGTSGTPAFGSVPSTPPALPPVDPAADNLIAEQFARYPEARYRITQLAFVQEHALAEAQNRIRRLEWDVQQAQAAAQQAAAEQQAAAQPPASRGFLGGLFGGGAAAPAANPGVWGPGAARQAPPNWQQQAPPQPQYAQGYQPGMFQRQGSGFLGSALTTAAGVAGGVVAGNVLMDMFSSHREGGFLGGGAAPVESAGSPWGNSALPAAPQADYVDQGSWTTPDQSAPATDDASWSQPQPDPSSWTDNSDGGAAGGDWGGDPGGSSDDNNLI
jgi:hypothetical protein